MDEVVPGPLKKISRDTAQECAASGCAIYGIFTFIAINGHRVDCERLLLPSGRNGAIEQILASLQLVSFKAPVERQTFAADFETKRLDVPFN
jgi:hypothetical protein